MNIVEKTKAPTPTFFRMLRSIGLALLALSGSVIAAPVILPAVVVSVAGYLAVAGAVLSAVSQMTVDDDAKAEEDLLNRMRKDNENLPRDGIK
jgi:energy-converting hydrogenase Eha subunit G